MHRYVALALSTALLIGSGSLALSAAKPEDRRTDAEIEAATKLQVFLDRANFSPGKIDGYYGDFTYKALDLYRQARGEKPATTAKPGAKGAPDLQGIDLASVDPVFTPYIVTEADLAQIGELPEPVEEKAKLKWLPYVDAVEAIAEKFHSDRDFIVRLNPGKTENLKVGDELMVPNVEPFDVDAVKQKKEEAGKKGGKPEPPPGPVSVEVRSGSNMLEIYEGDQLVAAYPVTIGARDNESPAGDWKVKGVALLPDYRHDESMLKEGKRSSDFKILPPGPNNPVGVTWVALDKDGIGLHGTDDPDSIGRASSHGCVRLANWDIVRILPKVKTGVAVTIR